MLNQPTTSLKIPQPVLDKISAFPPNRDTLGGTSYLIVENEGNILLDCPPWNEVTQSFLQEQGGVKWLFITHRGGIGRLREIQETFGCDVLIQEQEAYLLPGLKKITFEQEFQMTPLALAIWTPGHSPGSACLYYRTPQGAVLFSGRHLLPSPEGQLGPLRIATTFHWPRQMKSVQSLINRFTPETLHYICPGANTGFLRGKRLIDRAYERLKEGAGGDER